MLKDGNSQIFRLQYSMLLFDLEGKFVHLNLIDYVFFSDWK